MKLRESRIGRKTIVLGLYEGIGSRILTRKVFLSMIYPGI